MKKLIICADGTWNSPDQEDNGKRKPTNVIKLARAILPSDTRGTSQIVFYDQGIGTGWGLGDRLVGGAFGRGLSENVLQCYQFLNLNYEPSDQIYLFGFSRGAYTVRSLAGLIGTVGLLPKENAFYMPEAFALYRDCDDVEEIEKFKIEQGAYPAAVDCIGAWDTVGALGIPVGILDDVSTARYSFHNVDLGGHIKCAFQALAIDERRKIFAPAVWESASELPRDRFEQAWFAGVHTNVGGGYEPDGLANCALHWMVDKVSGPNSPIDMAFDLSYLEHYVAVPTSKLRNSKKGIYRVLGSFERPMGNRRNSNESIHESVFARLSNDSCEYEPPNLMACLADSPEAKSAPHQL